MKWFIFILSFNCIKNMSKNKKFIFSFHHIGKENLYQEIFFIGHLVIRLKFVLVDLFSSIIPDPDQDYCRKNNFFLLLWQINYHDYEFFSLLINIFSNCTKNKESQPIGQTAVQRSKRKYNQEIKISHFRLLFSYFLSRLPVLLDQPWMV